MLLTTTKSKNAIVAIFLLLIITAVASYLILENYKTNNKWVNHTYEVIQKFENLQANFNAAESEARAYIISADTLHSSNYRHRSSVTRQLIEEARQLTIDNPVQQTNGILLQKYAEEKLANLEYKMNHRQIHGLDQFLLTSTRSGSQLMHKAESLIINMVSEEKHLLAIRNKKVTNSRNIATLLIITGSIINFVIVIWLIAKTNKAFENRQLARAKLVKSYRHIVGLNRQKNYLLGMAAHDLRNPVANITQICELMFPEIKNKISKEDFEFLKNIQVSSMYVSSLLNDLLDVAKIESGKLILNYSIVQVHPYITNICKLNRLSADKKHIRLILDYTTSELLSIEIDAVKIEQVINNLISNAVKFSPVNSNVYINVSQQQNRLYVSVKDEGPGIPSNEQHKLFKAFQKTSVTATGGEKSTGLGLMISANIVKEHGGTLLVNSEPGKGSEFYFLLPVQP